MSSGSRQHSTFGGELSGLVHTTDAEYNTYTIQLATVSKRRLTNQLGRLSNDDLQAVERVIKIQLNLS